MAEAAMSARSWVSLRMPMSKGVSTSPRRHLIVAGAKNCMLQPLSDLRRGGLIRTEVASPLGNIAIQWWNGILCVVDSKIISGAVVHCCDRKLQVQRTIVVTGTNGYGNRLERLRQRQRPDK